MNISQTKKYSPLKPWWFASTFVVAVLAVLSASVVMNSADAKVDREELRIATVQEGRFAIQVRAPGVLVPKEVRWLTSEVSGSVERVMVKPGSLVKEGDVIAELSNPLLVQQLEEVQWDLEAMQAEQDSEIQNLESRQLEQELAELNAKNQFQNAEVSYKAHLRLRDQNMSSISAIDFKAIHLQAEQYQAQWEIEKKRSANLANNIRAQIVAKKAHLKKLKKQIARASTRVANLSIKASIDSVVQEVAIELGQQVQQGGNIAKLVRQNELIAQLQVPEMHIHNVGMDQPVMVNTRSSVVEGKVIRISPSVVEGTVEVDVEILEPLPNEARPELTVEAEIMVAAIEHAVYVDRPLQSKNEQSMRLFKLSPDGKKAEKVAVMFGKGSSSAIEVTSGLRLGDQIIVSDQSRLSAFETLAIRY